MIRYHPIHFSTLMAVLILAIAAGLSFYLGKPLVFLVALLILPQFIALGRFEAPGSGKPAGPYDGSSSGFGFMAPDDPDEFDD